MFDEMSDAQLCRASREGRTEAFTELVRRHQAAVCAVTYAATGRQDLSEDLAQETFLIAWKKLHGIEAPDRVAGWLVGIARNLARRTRRREARNEPLRELEPLDRELGLEDAAVDRETRSRVWELLATLPSRYREVMVLYYREGKSAPRVAGQLGISLSAAEQRLSRGRRLLRDKFERVVEDELARTRPTSALTRKVAAALPIGAWIPGAAASQGVGPALAVLTQAFAMKKIIAIAIAIVAALLVGYFALSTGSSEPEASHPAESSEVSPIERAAFEGDERSTIVAGTVIDADTDALQAGAVVSITRPDGSAVALPAEDGTLGPAIVRGNEDGAWSIRGLPPGRYLATASAEGKSSSEAVALAVVAERNVEGVVIALSAGGVPVAGVVSDLGGGPVAGAVVRAHQDGGAFVATITDDDGRYRLALERGRHLVSVWEADYEAVEESVSVRGPRHVIDFELVPAATITGRIVRRDTGEPVGGAVVSFTQLIRLSGGFRSTRATEEQTAVSDAQGRFVLRRLRPAEYQLLARGDRLASRAPTEVAIGIAEQATDVVVLVDPAFNVRGRIVDADDPKLGIADAGVSAMSPGSDHQAFARTREDGSFELVGMLPGQHALSVEASGMIDSSMEQKVEVERADVEGLEIALERGVEIRGRVVPPGPAEIKLGLLEHSGGLDVMFKGRKIRSARTRSDARGEFVIGSVPSGTWKVLGTAIDGSKGEAEVTITGDSIDGVELRLAPRASIRGVITNAAGEPVRAARVRMSPDRGIDKRPDGLAVSFRGETTHADETGAFEFVGLDPGRYRLTANDRDGQVLPRLGRGSDDAGWVVDVPVQGTTTTLVVETPTGVISGTVLDGDGGPVPDAYVTLHTGESDVLSDEQLVTISDASGRFAFERLSDGAYAIDARSHRGDAAAAPANVRAGDRVGLVLEEFGSISGRVTADGRSVEMFEIDAGSQRSFVTADGSFDLQRIAPGHHTLVVTADRGSGTASVEVRPGEAARVTIELGPWATLKGRAVWPDGELAAGLSVGVHARGGERDRGERVLGDFSGTGGLTTDAEGRFEIQGIGAGRGTLSFADGGVRGGGRRHGGAVFHVDAGKTLDLGDIVLLERSAPTAESGGDLGLVVSQRFEAPSHPEPPGAPSGPASLWIEHIDPAGPASDLGLRSGQRILAFEGRSIEELGAGNAAVLLADDRIESGRRYRLVVETADGERTIDIVAAPTRFGR